MYGKLAFRNIKRSARDYLVYFFTMTFVTALMFAFNSILFSKDVQALFEVAGIMAAMIGLATFFIVLIIAWLINYMIRFMLEKRSREFGIYLLIGMKKKKIARLYMQENIFLGVIAFFLGMGIGFFIQQILMAILYSMIQMDYHLHLTFSKYCIFMTAGCYAGCYLLALFQCGRRFKKMNIRDLMSIQNENEEIRESHEKIKSCLFPISVIFLVLFAVFMLSGMIRGVGTAVSFLVGLILVIYFFYLGFASWVGRYVRKKRAAIYKGQNLFLLRQFSSKLKTMGFTMGTLTSLFTIAFLGCTVAMMFNDYQNQILKDKFPFDIQVYSGSVEDDFADEWNVIRENTVVKDSLSYHIYENETNQVNAWLYTHLRIFATTYQKDDGTANLEKIQENEERIYCDYDTYMGLSDYNHLRQMLGYPVIQLEDGEYAIHIKERIVNEVRGMEREISVKGINGNLQFTDYYTEPFSQDGHNGGDYLIIVPDEELSGMIPYYSELAVDIQGKAPQDLGNLLDDLSDNHDFAGHPEMKGNNCYGSDTIVTYNAVNLVRDNIIPEVKYILSSIIFPCFYVGLVFVCIALTVLSVQQLSDSAKYKYRYSVLFKMGLSRKKIDRLILKQLFGYYLCPALFATFISGVLAVYMSDKFIFYTGVHTSVFQYFGIAFVLFFGIYFLYFIVTYIEFKRNVETT